MPSLPEFRRQLLSHSLPAKTTLRNAIHRMGFVQADPIRSPARCQDLILRHRVKNYKAGDLERKYQRLDLEEEYTFAYGFLPRIHRNILHPRSGRKLTSFEKRVVATVHQLGPSKSADLAESCGNASVRNAWGGRSKATKQALEKAHHFGYLRIAYRENGVRVYTAPAPISAELSPDQRFEKLLVLTTNLFGPTSPQFLLSELRHLNPERDPSRRKAILHGLIDQGKLQITRAGEVDYVMRPAKSTPQSNVSVKILSPFDPIVRDRDRFQHVWGWSYRFEAYTPAAKRVRGYYAMPVLWQDDVVGWANAKVTEQRLNVEVGYERTPQHVRRFKSALEQEVSELATFLHLEPDAWQLVQHPRSK